MKRNKTKGANPSTARHASSPRGLPVASDNRSRLARARSLHPAADYVAFFSSPEDVILMKLDFHRKGGSDKHLRDIAGVLRISGEQLDRAYLDSWARDMGLDEIWQALLNRVGKPP